MSASISLLSFLIVALCSHFSVTVASDAAANDAHVRLRRSNFPCGKSFIRCASNLQDVASEAQNDVKTSASIDALAFGVKTGESVPSIEASELEGFASLKKAGALRELSKLINAKAMRDACELAKQQIDELFNETETKIFNDFVATNFLHSTLAWAELTAMDTTAKALSYSALVSLAASQRLSTAFGLTADQIRSTLPAMPMHSSALARLCPVNAIVDCVPGKYRSYSGHCNNVRQPLWGATYEPFQRLQPPSYADGIGAIRLAHNGSELPSTRILSRRLMTALALSPRANASAESVRRETFATSSLMIAQWAQFLYEDMSQIASNRLFHNDKNIPIPCCAEKHPECMPILSDPDDTNFQGRAHCLPYARSFVSPRENCTLGVREQGNTVSSFIDANHIYGKSAAESKQLRLFSDGLLKTSAQSQRKDLLPPLANWKGCASSSAALRPCFESGSPLTNLLPTSAALHTVFVRQHNFIAKHLKEVNAYWDDERLFQESRRILTAQIQHITFNEFLPIIVGRDRLRSSGLALRAASYDSDYNIRTNPSTLNEYASGAGLFFFALFPDALALVDADGLRSQKRHLSNVFNDPSQLYLRDRLDATLRFLLREPSRPPRPILNAEWREKFLRGPDLFGLDLGALLLQMGRDHGLNAYVEWREACQLTRPKSFEDLGEIVHGDFDWTVLREVYGSVEDLDLFVMGLAEKPLNGAMLGPTFVCIISRQFEKVRHGDRFWYENFFQPSAFSAAQLNEIRGTTLSSIICENTDDIGMIQPNVFQLPDEYGNCPMACNVTSVNRRMDFRVWVDAEQKHKLPITKETLEKALKLGAEQFRRLQEAESGRINRQRAASPPGPSAFAAHANLLAPKRESLDIAQTAGILRETTNVLLRGSGLSENERLPSELDLSTLQKLLPEVEVSRVVGNISDYLFPHTSTGKDCLPRPLPCDHTSKYRTISGWCNNLRFPSYGNAFEPLRRLLDPAYDDGFDTPRTRSKSGRPLPSARKVSNAVHSDEPIFHVKFSHMLMQMGQMVDHDMTHSPIARGPNNAILNCSRCDSPDTLSIHCFPIPIEAGDPFFPATHSDGSPRCMPFARSLLGQLTLGYRNQLNQLTSFLDASNIYGSTECEANALRLFSRGRLNFTDLGYYNREALPQGPQERDCRSRPRHPCFVAGDERNNEQPGLTVLHTLLLREHNRIASTLSQINAFWSDERLFQESRRIMIAKQQHIIFNEFLPVVLGCETMSKYDLMPLRYGYYAGYDAQCDASISQELATAAFRFGHTLIRNNFPRMNATFGSHAAAVDLGANFNNASMIYDHTGGHIESLLMGLLGTAGMEYDRHIVDAVRNHLFQKPGGPLTGLDLPAVNIQRGRDHGIRPYNAYREICGLPRALSFDDLLTTMDEGAVGALKRAYAHVDDIDLFPGIMSERPLKGALVGPSLACIIAEQFQRLKRCDRFYYENDDPLTRFTPSQLAEIRKATLSKMICENSEFAKRIQPNALLLPDDLTNAPIKCSELAATDLYEWIDRQFCVVDQRIIRLGKTKRVTPCITCTCTAEGPECHSITVERCEDLFTDYLLSEIKQDTVCVIQCSKTIREQSNRYRNGFDSNEI